MAEGNKLSEESCSNCEPQVLKMANRSYNSILEEYTHAPLSQQLVDITTIFRANSTPSYWIDV